MKTKMLLGLLSVIFVTIFTIGCSSRQASVESPDCSFSQDDGIFLYPTGEFQVFMMVESMREGNTGILVGADEELLSRYIPETGFQHTANAYFVKTPDHNILIDTGTGIDGIIADKIKKIGLEPEEIDTVLITHLHRDHFGGLVRDGATLFPNATVYLSYNEHEYFTEIQVNQDAVATLALYEGKIELFNPAQIDSVLEEILPGIKPIANYGHTPGHTVFLIEDNDEKLIIAGDFLHLALVQFAVPEISATFDVDKEEAAAARRQLMNYAAQNNIPLGGMHIVYPGIVTVEAEGDGFKYTPIN